MRIPIAALALVLLPSIAAAQGRERGLTLAEPVGDLAVSGHIRLPPPGRPARCAIVALNWAMSRGVFESPRWRDVADALDCAMLLLTLDGAGDTLPPERQPVRQAAAGGSQALEAMLKEFGERVHRPELRSVPLVFWGFSASGGFGTTFAELHPARSVAVIRFQSPPRGTAVDHRRIVDIPHLLIAGDADGDDAREMWQTGRAVGAPWTFLLQSGKKPGDGLAEATDLILSWMACVIRLRTSGTGPLLRIDPATTWFGDHETGRLTRGPRDAAGAGQTSWLPDERTAALWRALVQGGSR